MFLGSVLKDLLMISGYDHYYNNNNENITIIKNNNNNNNNNRFKPDLVITGDPIMSAKANGNSGQSCNTVEKIGFIIIIITLMIIT